MTQSPATQGPGLAKCWPLLTSPANIAPSRSDRFRRAIGIILAISVFALMAMVFAALFGTVTSKTTATTATANSPDIAHLVRMSLIQAMLSTFFSLLSGILGAWALNRTVFPGRKILISLLATAIVAPGLVVALGIINIWGNGGWVNQLLAPLQTRLPGSIFGLHGIVLAHTVLNGAFAAHILLTRLTNIEGQKLKIGQSLALTPWQRFKILDWPVLSGALPPLASIIFLLAFTSFPIVLLLGGGPANQTLEVAIYTAIRFDFNLNFSVTIALVQVGICMLIILPALFATPSLASAGLPAPHPWRSPKPLRIFQATILVLIALGFILPLLSIIIKGVGPDIFTTLSRASFWRATATSLVLGTISAALTIFVALRIAMAHAALKSKFAGTVLSLPLFAYLVMPSLVLALGFFLASRHLNIPPSLGAPVILVIANVLLALPFTFAALAPALTAIDKRYNRLSRTLNLSGFNRWRYVEWPLLGREMGLASALAFCFSLGDLAIISLFNTSQFTTLPWAMFRAMGAYRTNEAATIAALILFLCFAVFWILPELFQRMAKKC